MLTHAAARRYAARRTQRAAAAARALRCPRPARRRAPQAVTATGAIVLAASEEFIQLRTAERGDRQAAARSVGATEAGLLGAGEPSLWDLGLFIFSNAAPAAGDLVVKARERWAGEGAEDVSRSRVGSDL